MSPGAIKMNPSDIDPVQVARNNTDRETTARRRKALKRWSVLSMIALFLSLGLIVIAFVQITESKGDLAPLAGFGFILPSGITGVVASGLSLISSVWLGYKVTCICLFKFCTVCFFIIGVLSVVSIVGSGVLAIFIDYKVEALNPIVVCVCILLSGIITAAMVVVCCHCSIFFHSKSVKGEEERFHMQQSGLQVVQAGSQQATGFKDQTEYQPFGNNYIYQQKRGSSMPVPQGQGQMPPSMSLGQGVASNRDTISGASNIKSQGQAPASFTSGQNSASYIGIVHKSSNTHGQFQCLADPSAQSHGSRDA